MPNAPTPPGTPEFQNFAGGGYFFLDEDGRIWSATKTNHLFVLRVAPTAAASARSPTTTSRAPWSGDERISSALPDFRGRIWFVTKPQRQGRDPQHATRRIRVDPHRRGDPELVHGRPRRRLHRLRQAHVPLQRGRDGRPRVDWQVPYDNSGIVKPGQADAGSGTTPTILPRRLRRDHRQRRPDERRRLPQGQARGRAAWSARCRSSRRARAPRRTRCSARAARSSSRTTTATRTRSAPNAGKLTTPGFARVDVGRNGRGCRKVWENHDRARRLGGPKLSTRTGMIYTYTQDPGRGPGQEQWSWVGLSARTGRDGLQESRRASASSPTTTTPGSRSDPTAPPTSARSAGSAPCATPADVPLRLPAAAAALALIAIVVAVLVGEAAATEPPAAPQPARRSPTRRCASWTTTPTGAGWYEGSGGRRPQPRPLRQEPGRRDRVGRADDPLALADRSRRPTPRRRRGHARGRSSCSRAPGAPTRRPRRPRGRRRADADPGRDRPRPAGHAGRRAGQRAPDARIARERPGVRARRPAAAWSTSASTRAKALARTGALPRLRARAARPRRPRGGRLPHGRGQPAGRPGRFGEGARCPTRRSSLDSPAAPRGGLAAAGRAWATTPRRTCGASARRARSCACTREDPGASWRARACTRARTPPRRCCTPPAETERFGDPSSRSRPRGATASWPRCAPPAARPRAADRPADGRAGRAPGPAPALYRALRPGARSTLLTLAARRTPDRRAPAALTVTSSVRDERYQRLLVRRNTEATRRLLAAHDRLGVRHRALLPRPPPGAGASSSCSTA